MSGLHAADGSLNITVVDGTTLTGLYAADGSFNVVVVSGGGLKGIYHPCGALNVTVVTSGLSSFYAADGSMNISVSPYVTGSQEVTVVAGSLSPGGTGFLPFGLLTVYFG